MNMGYPFLRMKLEILQNRWKVLDEIQDKIEKVIKNLPEGSEERDQLMFKKMVINLLQQDTSDITSLYVEIDQIKSSIEILWSETLGKDKSFTLPYEKKDKSVMDRVEEQEGYKKVVEWVKKDLEEKAKDTEFRDLK
ncbi:DUF342 domain-containing protein [Candidatus Nitrosocosmicus sp. SS]|uniref:DUF342 domain-containing protein n=2 Tax=Candidatus Nitrosocosmicus agrestis TaxID=2563600 RepID=UPI00122DDAF8|nr:DUF342 domain-containing protein [Candidatus Nitrosocosmicus sp. SS]KAF0870240.1 DUF342 domain-containing protein [Candidatus Nitrosocosmicus sp. SS]